MALNSTYILRFIEKKLGYKFNELEISPQEIIENIQNETLRVFSKHFPYVTSVTISEKDLVEDTKSVYYLNTPFEIMNVAKVIHNNYIYSDTNPLTRIDVMGDPFSKQMNADLYSAIKNPMTFRFIYPNMIEIQPAYNIANNVVVKLNCIHPKHFGTIPVNLQDEFLKLALYDTKEALYLIRRRFANLQTPYGNIELFIDDLQDAADKRNEMLEYWRRHIGKQANRKKIYIY